ncbi:hypothetical protein Dimus_023789 [Dionaea muscipula]
MLCHDDEKSALIQFKQSFSLVPAASTDLSAYPKTLSWKPTGNGSDCCIWDGVECDQHSSHVVGLDLSSSFLDGPIPHNSSLFELVHLRSLNLSDNNFRYSQIPSRLGLLKNLRYLNLSQSRLSGQVPIEVSTLSKLISLDLSLNIEPSSGFQLLKLQNPSLTMLVQNLTALEVLSLSEVSISSQVPEMIANLKSLKRLLLKKCGLYATFPNGIFLLPELEILDLASNAYLSGYFPKFHNTCKLKSIYIAGTGFYGQVPPSIENLSLLEQLDISQCNFESSIPASLGKLSQLTYLDLSSNHLIGKVPLSLTNLSRLSYLNLGHNNLDGEIPFSIGKLSRLTHLELSDNNLIAKVPVSLANLTRLSYLNLADNNLVGEVPSLANLTRLAFLVLGNNSIQGPIPVPPPSLVMYDVRVNELKGEIPTAFCNATSLQILRLSFNKLSGRIPRCLFKLNNHMTYLDLRANLLHGMIPETFPSSCKLKAISLGMNQLEGGVPRSLANCTSLAYIDLSSNNISDTFPIWLSTLPLLQALNLHENTLHGPLPVQFRFSFPKLHLLCLSQNQFTGEISNELFNDLYGMQKPSQMQHQLEIPVPLFLLGVDMIKSFTFSLPYSTPNDIKPVNEGISIILPMVIDLSSNSLVGKIPNSIGNLVALHYVDLSGNNFTGTIPSSFMNLSNLEYLDLSHNQLSGDIPQQLSELTFLGHFNVSYNRLTGHIPQGFQFDTFGKDCYMGNPGLCGSPLSNKCGNLEVQETPGNEPPVTNKDEESSTVIDWVVRLMGYLSGLPADKNSGIAPMPSVSKCLVLGQIKHESAIPFQAEVKSRHQLKEEATSLISN